MHGGLATRIAIVGGGISGLSLGYQLVRRGVPVEVLEAGSRAGGNIRSEARDGYLCEWGPNGFLANEPATLRLVDALGLRDDLAPSSELARVRWIVRGGRLRALPKSPPGLLASDALSFTGKLRVLMEWAPPARRDPTDESVFDFARRRVGREAAEVLVDAMVTGIYAGDARALSLQAAFPRMRAMEIEHGGLLKAMRALRRAKRAARSASAGGAAAATPSRADAPGGPMGPGGVLTSFVDGMETLPRALAGALGEHLHLGAEIASLSRIERGWRLDFVRGRALEAEQIVLACPAPVAAQLLAPLDDTLAEELRGIPWSPVAVVCLGYSESDLRDVQRGFGFLVPGRERLPILGTLFDTWVFPKRSPVGRVLWRAILGGARDRGAVDLTDDELVQRVLRTLEKLLGLRAAPEMTSVVRHPRGIPQYPVGHLERLARVDEKLARLPGLVLAGNSYRGIAMNSCIKEAEALAERLAGEPIGSSGRTS